MRRFLLSAALLAGCGRSVPVIYLPGPPPEPGPPPAESYEVTEDCPEGTFLHVFDVFPDGSARVLLSGPGTAVHVGARAVALPDGSAFLAYESSSKPIGVSEGEALVLLERTPYGAVVLHWESWQPSCGEV